MGNKSFALACFHSWGWYRMRSTILLCAFSWVENNYVPLCFLFLACTCILQSFNGFREKCCNNNFIMLNIQIWSLLFIYHILVTGYKSTLYSVMLFAVHNCALFDVGAYLNTGHSLVCKKVIIYCALGLWTRRKHQKRKQVIFSWTSWADTLMHCVNKW